MRCTVTKGIAVRSPLRPTALARKGIKLLPDILANAGGVTVSYFEWVQELRSFFWSEAEVNAKLETVMPRAFQEVHESARKHRTHMRPGAYCLAVGRVADATLVRGLYSQK
jgi:glutamate dehydrogenase (NAD(P)+)